MNNILIDQCSMLVGQCLRAVCLLLVFGVSFPLSAEAVETFGPMHVLIATKVTKTSLWFLRIAKEQMVPPYAVLQVALGVLQK